MAEIEVNETPAESLTLIPKHLPSAGQLLELKARGLGVAAIAEQINQSVRTTKELLTQAQRSATIRAAKDILIRDLVPRIVDNLAVGLDPRANKRDLDAATFALNLADRIGLTDLKEAVAEHTRTETFEEFMFKRTVKHEVTQSSAADQRRADEPVATATRVDLSHGEPAVNAAIDAEVIESGDGAAATESA
jgi:hypothetical protein